MVMNPNSVFRVVADGIYFWRSYEIVDGEYKDIENFEEIIQELPVMLDMEFQEPFQYKNIFIEDRKIRLGSNNGFESNYFSTQNQSFIEGISADGCTDEKYTHSMKNLYLGIGGSGKTYNLLTDQGYINMYYLAPTRKLRTYTKHKYGEYKNIIGFYTIAKALGKDQKTLNRIKTYAKNIVIDEASMLNEKDKLDLMKTFEGIKLHFLGDIGYQLNPIDGNPMNLSNFDNIYEYKTSIRIKDEKLRSIINQIRDVQKTKNKNIRNIFPVILKSFENISNEQLYQQYKLEDYILCYTKNCCKNHTDNLKKQFLTTKKYRVTDSKSHSELETGDIIITNEIPTPKVGTKIEECYAFTTHVVQGETIKSNIFIDIEDMVNKTYNNNELLLQLLQTAIGRVEFSHQIKLICNTF